MAKFRSLAFVIILSFFLCYCRVAATNEDRKDYIIYMGSFREGQYSPLAQHLSLLEEIGESSAKNYLIRSYKRSFNGFAARLTEEQRQKLAKKKEVVSIFPNRNFQLQTTRSWDFIGVNDTISRQPTTESDTIIGVIDTGIWPESDSFSDKGFSLIPKKWKGACEGGANFTCNNKLIGVRNYIQNSDTARDEKGHGTHCASTAAGNEVEGVSFYGLAEGTARGGVPSARIAAYKVCNDSDCGSAEILSAFDDAIADGVDIITISIGASWPEDFASDPIAIGAFHAMEKGILVVAPAGNAGNYFSVTSVAPWMLSVAASSTDRRIIDRLILGSGEELGGVSINAFASPPMLLPLITGEQASRKCLREDARQCSRDCLEKHLVRGKIVVCEEPSGVREALRAGADGVIVLRTWYDYENTIVPLPAMYLGANETEVLKSYLKSTRAPLAKLLKSEVVKDPAAPVVSSFSSRGPNKIAGDILKPDITAPGEEILAAYSPSASPTGLPHDKRSVKYSIKSGTSMSCAHVAGIAAYVKSIHPNWSPSTIQSAIMTTASPMSPTKLPVYKNAEFAYGAGHVNAAKATNPGLVYEASSADYIEMLCSLGYDESKLHLISGNRSTCPKKTDQASVKNLNYPSLTAAVEPEEAFSVEFTRRVTHVASARSTYTAKVSSPSKIKVDIKPSTLSFKSVNETKSFIVTVSGDGLELAEMVSAYLVWSDDAHSVRSPIVVYSKRHF